MLNIKATIRITGYWWCLLPCLVFAELNDTQSGLVFNSSTILFMPGLHDTLSKCPEPEGAVGGPGGGDGWGGGNSTPMQIIVLGNTLGSQSGQSAGGGDSDGADSDKPPDQPVSTDPTAGQGGGNHSSEEAGAAGGGQRPAKSSESLLADLDAMLFQLDELMQIFDGEVVLVSDLDDTLLPSNSVMRGRQQVLRQAFKTFVEKWRAQGKLRLIIVTRAELTPENWNHFANNQLPDPDYLISCSSLWNASLSIQAREGVAFADRILPAECLSPGAQITASGIFIKVFRLFLYQDMTRYESRIKGYFSDRGMKVQLDNYQGGFCFTLLFSSTVNLTEQTTKDKIKQLAFDMYGVLVDVAYTEGQTVKLLLPTSKGALLERLAKAMSLTGAIIVAAGDQQDDASMLVSQQAYQVHTGIVVGNGDWELGKTLNKKSPETISQSKQLYLLGVIEGLLKAMQCIVTQPDS